jgi:hypothetical protein
MSYDGYPKLCYQGLEIGTAVSQPPDPSIVRAIIAVLKPHPRVPRRWSVIRAICADRGRDSRGIQQKFEEQVERTFQRSCADATEAPGRVCPAGKAPFYRPQDTAAKVRVLFPDRLAALFDSRTLPVAEPDK